MGLQNGVFHCDNEDFNIEDDWLREGLGWLENE